MPYLGTPAATGFSKTTKDRFNGDNSTTGFTMSQAAGAGTDIQVFVDNIRQEPTVAYSVSGATLTFTEAPPTGTNNVYVIHQHQALGTGTLPPQDLGSKDYIFGDDISFRSDSAKINFGLDSEVNITHVHNTGLLLNGTNQLQFGDSGTHISQSADGVLDLVADSEIEINATTIDINGAVDISGNTTVGGTLGVTGLTTASAGIDINGTELILDADADTSITADTDDQIDIKLGGSDSYHFKATAAHGNGIGIGTNAPLRQVHISNTSANSEIAFTAGTSGTSSILFGDGLSGTDVYRGYIQYQHSDDDMLFATSATERMRITTEGRMNINTGVDDSTGFRFFAPSGQATKVAEFALQNGVGCHLPVNSTAFTASSDETLKKNITEFDKQESYDNIKNLRAVTFNYKDWTLNGINYQDDKKRIGFIAQDWQTNYPEVIDKDQNDKLCMKYTETIPVLLSALQKAQEKIEALEAEVAKLKG